MLELRRDNPAKRFGTVRKQRVLVVIGCCALFAGPAAASAAKPSSEGVVLARYQAVSRDTATDLERLGSGQVPGGAMREQHARIPAIYLDLRAQERCSTFSRYQSREAISNSREVVSFAFPTSRVRSTSKECTDTASWIPNRVAGRISPTEARFLLQLAGAFAAAYVLFLAAWLWGTRDRRSRVGSAVRS
jgi:hypothetical protein